MDQHTSGDADCGDVSAHFARSTIVPGERSLIGAGAGGERSLSERQRVERPLQRALELAARGPAVDANPRVGCVLIRDGEPVGEGFHAGAGTPHAEVVALRAAGPKAAGATAYVTLEPCAHTGRTGPCAQALIDAGVTRVVYADADPNPMASGGAEVLRAAGVEVERDLAAAEAARALNEQWARSMRLGRPVVTWKFAATLDGRSAAADGSSDWITSPEARADVARLRAECGAILVGTGTGTALADDPWLTVRDAGGRLAARQPLRVVLGERPLPASARVLDEAAETLVLRHRDPARALDELFARGVRQVWLEGGPTLAASFWRAGLVDRVIAYLAPALLGSGRAAVGDLGIASMGDVARLDLTSFTRVGPDVRLIATPKGH